MTSALPTRHILLVDDEPDVLEMVRLNLLRAGGFTVSTASDGVKACKQAREKMPSLIVLDLMMPKMPGLEVCRLLKADPVTSSIPIVILTARVEAVDRVVGLELGADDYVTKPFSPRELVLRIKAVLRRGEKSDVEQQIVVGPITVDPERHRVSVAGKAVLMTGIEFKLLLTFMERVGRVQERDRLLKDVWGYDKSLDTRTVDIHVKRLRGKLGKAAVLIETVRGFGYRLRKT